jgi:CRP-like cAMP-binding protein
MNLDLLLSGISKHVNLTSDEISYFTSMLTLKHVSKGEFLLREGEVCKRESFVNKGCLISYYMDENGHEHIIDFLVESWWANDLYSLFTQTPSTLAIKAIEETEVLQISRDNLEILYQKIPKFERFFRILFQRAYIAQREQINSVISIGAEERYRLFLQKKPYAEKRFAQKDIASYLGVTPQFLSTLKKNFVKLM